MGTTGKSPAVLETVIQCLNSNKNIFILISNVLMNLFTCFGPELLLHINKKKLIDITPIVEF